MRVKLVLIVLVFMQVVCLSQESEYEILDVSDGLPSNFVYRVYEDSKGYMWFATDKGAVRYDGHTMKVFDTSNGLPNDDVYKIQEDALGRIWIMTMSPDFCYYKSDSIYTIPSQINRHSSIFYMDTENTYFKGGEITQIDKDNITKIVSFNKNKGIGYFLEVDLGDFSYYHYLDTIANRSLESIGEKFLDYNTISKLKKVPKYEVKDYSIRGSSPTKTIYSRGKNEKQITIRSISREGLQDFPFLDLDYNHSVIPTYNYRDSLFQISNGDKILSLDSNLVKQEIYNIDTKGIQSINSLFLDSKKNIWISSPVGIYFYSNIKREYQFENIGNYGDNVEIVSANQEELLYANTLGQIKKHENRITSFINEKITSPPNRIYDVEYLKDTPYFTNRNSDYSIIDDKLEISESKIKYRDTLPPYSYFSFFCKEIEIYNDIIYCTGLKLFSWNPKIEKCQFLLDRTTVSLDIDTLQGTLLVSSPDSLYFYSGLDDENFQKKDSISLPGVSYIMSIGKGMFICSDKKRKSYTYTLNQGLRDIHWLSSGEYIIKNIFTEDHIVTLTNISIYRSTKNPKEFEATSERIFTVNEILEKIKINDISYLNGYLFLGTTQGLKRIKLKFEKSINNYLEFYITKINGLNYNTDSNFNFDYNTKSIKIDYSIIDLNGSDNLYIKYILDGPTFIKDSTEKRFIDFARLSPGNYSLKLTPKKHGDTVSKSKIVRFKISKPYWQTIWFISLLVLLGLMIIGALSYLYVRRLNKKATISQKYAELELNALQSQMNPHFVFNAMNSIQNLINTDRVEAADKYLSKFARLMRQFLEVSRQKFIPLYEEIDIVEKYLELEILRFGSELTYTVQTSLTDDDMEMNVPATLVQPFVENAVIHGLFHKKRKGHINISLYKKKETIYIEIDDDGIGRIASQVINQNRSIAHVSRGKELIDEKMIVLNQMKMYEIAYETIDKYENETTIGTLVTIRIKQSNES